MTLTGWNSYKIDYRRLETYSIHVFCVVNLCCIQKSAEKLFGN